MKKPSLMVRTSRRKHSLNSSFGLCHSFDIRISTFVNSGDSSLTGWNSSGWADTILSDDGMTSSILA